MGTFRVERPKSLKSGDLRFANNKNPGPDNRPSKRKVNKMTKMKFREVPKFEEVDVVAKTCDSVTGTIDRKTIGRALITTAEGFEGKHEVVDGDGTTIRTVKEFGKEENADDAVEVVVELVGGVKSLASYKFFKGYKAANAENPDVMDVFTEDGAQINKIVATAERMCAAHPECDGQWKVVTKSEGRRVFLRLIATNLDATGKIRG